MGDVGALRHVDDDGIGQAGDQVIVLEGAAEPARLDPHHRIALGVEVRIALEHLGSDRVGLDPVPAPGERLLDDVAQELARTRGEVEIGAGDEAFELGAHVFSRRL